MKKADSLPRVVLFDPVNDIDLGVAPGAGTAGSAAPASAQQIGGAAPDGTLQPASVTQGGAILTATPAQLTTSRSGTVVTGGAYQLLAPQDPDRQAFVIQNRSAAPMFVADRDTAPADDTDSFLIGPGQEKGIVEYRPTRKMWLKGGTASDLFVARDASLVRPSALSTGVMTAYPASGKMGMASGFRGAGMQQSIRRNHRGVGIALRDLYIDLPNWIVATTGVETPNTNDIVVFAALEYPAGTTPQPFLVDTSYAAVSSAPAASAYQSTGVYVPAGQTGRARLSTFLPASPDYFIHLWVAPAAGGVLTPGAGVIPAGRFTQNASYADKYAEGASAPNRTATIGGETTAIAAPANLYCPIVVAGTPVDAIRAAQTPSFVLWGDSIMFGFNEQNAYSADTYGNVGPGERWLAGSLGYGAANLGVSSTKAKQWVDIDRGLFPRTLAAVQGLGTHHVLEFGINDLATDTAAQLQASIERFASFWSSRGRRVYATTITPKSSSTDAWATTANQTPDSSNAQRVAYNTVVRAFGLANVTGYIEFADQLESARNSGVWKAPGYTADGLHGSGTAYAALATALTATPPAFLVR